MDEIKVNLPYSKLFPNMKFKRQHGMLVNQLDWILKKKNGKKW